MVAVQTFTPFVMSYFSFHIQCEILNLYEIIDSFVYLFDRYSVFQ